MWRSSFALLWIHKLVLIWWAKLYVGDISIFTSFWTELVLQLTLFPWRLKWRTELKWTAQATFSPAMHSVCHGNMTNLTTTSIKASRISPSPRWYGQSILGKQGEKRGIWTRLREVANKIEPILASDILFASPCGWKPFTLHKRR